jgi:outer membrane lipoprotein SlyB
MKKSVFWLIVFGSFFLSACATQTGWTPTIDSYNDANAFRLNQDMTECQQLAERASGGTAQQAATGAAGGALIGAAGGAILGAIFGNPGTGAAAGAASGGIGGATRQGLNAEAQYKHAYSNCLRGRGHHVVN